MLSAGAAKSDKSQGGLGDSVPQRQPLQARFQTGPDPGPSNTLSGSPSNTSLALITIFGQNPKAMEKIFDDEQFPSHCLIKVVLKRSRILGLRRSVLTYGVCESAVFPDLDGLAREIRREFGFEV
jgi:hypothetical protein